MEKPAESGREASPLSMGGWVTDYVIVFKGKDAGLERLLNALYAAGLVCSVRVLDDERLAVMVYCPDARLRAAVRAAREKDYLYGIKATVEEAEIAPRMDGAGAPGEPQAPGSAGGVQPSLAPAERLRYVFEIISLPRDVGGAGVVAGHAPWTEVESILPLHDDAFNKAWLKKWNSKLFVDNTDLDEIRDYFGERVALYFAFLRYYFQALAYPAVAGMSCYALGLAYSPLYSAFISGWAVCFIELWRRKELDFAVRWGVRHISRIETRRALFKGEYQAPDPITEDVRPQFPGWKRTARELLMSVPVALSGLVVLGAILTGIFSVEVFIKELYAGPFQAVLGFSPTVLFAVLVPLFSKQYSYICEKLTMFENHETDGSYNASFTRKIFIINFMTSYTSLFLAAFIYTPFGHVLMPKVSLIGLTTMSPDPDLKPVRTFTPNPQRVGNQLFYFVVTAQIIAFATRLGLPYAQRLAFSQAKAFQIKMGKASEKSYPDTPNEANLMKKIRHEASLPSYDMYQDYCQIAVQFGYIVMFSVIWPLAPVVDIFNNGVELRSDAASICTNVRRPIPGRADSIGQWLDVLTFLTWVGSLTTAALIYLYGGGRNPVAFHPATLIAVVLATEHLYFVARYAIRQICQRLPQDSIIHASKEDFRLRNRRLKELNARHAPHDERGVDAAASSAEVEKRFLDANIQPPALSATEAFAQGKNMLDHIRTVTDVDKKTQ